MQTGTFDQPLPTRLPNHPEESPWVIGPKHLGASSMAFPALCRKGGPAEGHGCLPAPGVIKVDCVTTDAPGGGGEHQDTVAPLCVLQFVRVSPRPSARFHPRKGGTLTSHQHPRGRSQSLHCPGPDPRVGTRPHSGLVRVPQVPGLRTIPLPCTSFCSFGKWE